MSADPFEPQVDAFLEHEGNTLGVIDRTKLSTEWMEFRDVLASMMWDARKAKCQR